MRKIYLFLVIFFLNKALSGQNYTSYFTGNTTNIATVPQGGICLMGGATENDEAMKWFLQRSNGGDVLVLRTTGGNGYNSYLYSSLGVQVNSVETIVCNNAAASGEAYIKQKIQSAEAIWFAGGDQWTYVSYWRNTAIDSLVNDAIANRHIVVGGTSAGMSIMGKYYFSAQNGTVTSAAALANPYAATATVDSARFIKNAWLADVITDTHYDNPDRRGRHATFLARIKQDWNTNAKGIACDEYTAVCIDNEGLSKVYGSYPTYDDNAYFIQSNCEVANNVPETCTAGTPLTWNQNGQALKVYAVKGTAAGSNSFSLSNWKTGTGGSWQRWYVANGIWQSATTAPINCTGLPVTWLAFTATKNKAEVVLHWQTANELNTSHFNVQRSSDGVHFETLQKVTAMQGNGGIKAYSFTDRQPRTGLNYYRLQQADKDGSLNYSAIVTVDFVNTRAFSIYPNPCTTKEIYVNDAGSHLQKMVITDAAGKKILMQTSNSTATMHYIDIAVLKTGIYFVQFYSEGETVVEVSRLVVQ